MQRAGKYNVLRDFGEDADPTHITMDPHWVVAVVRLGMPLSFSRATMESVTKDLTQGAMMRSKKPLVISDDVAHVSIQGSKSSHKKQMSLGLIESEVNYLTELKNGDHVLAWLVNNRSDFKDLLSRIDENKPCNDFNSGLKFVGRATSIRKHVSKDPNSGMLTSTYAVQCTGFDELDANFYYDNSLASKDVLERDYGQWLTRIGLDVQRLFGTNARDGISKNNINRLIPTLLNLIVGSGPGSKGNIDVIAADGKNVSATPQLQDEAPYSYMIPMQVGQLLGKGKTESGKPSYVLGYSNILELVQGVQSYSNKEGWQVFIPDLSEAESTSQRRVCPRECLGTFLPFMPDFANKPVWSVMQQYQNPTINEMFTCLRVNPEGKVVPTIVLRQIPFTTDAFVTRGSLSENSEGPRLSPSETLAVTRFLDLPRWIIPEVMINTIDIGCSDQTRVNLVHVYASNSYQQNAIAIQEQIVNNPPILDRLDIMRSGVRPYMATVECWVDDTVGKAPRDWMNLIADSVIGSQYTLNGTIQCVGIQSPICEGDNVEVGGIVFHIESISHAASISGDNGTKAWTTTLHVTNGMSAHTGGQTQYPVYAGFADEDFRMFDPGLSNEQGNPTTGGQGDLSGKAQEHPPELTSEQLGQLL